MRACHTGLLAVSYCTDHIVDIPETGIDIDKNGDIYRMAADRLRFAADLLVIGPDEITRATMSRARATDSETTQHTKCLFFYKQTTADFSRMKKKSGRIF